MVDIRVCMICNIADTFIMWDSYYCTGRCIAETAISNLGLIRCTWLITLLSRSSIRHEMCVKLSKAIIGTMFIIHFMSRISNQPLNAFKHAVSHPLITYISTTAPFAFLMPHPIYRTSTSPPLESSKHTHCLQSRTAAWYQKCCPPSAAASSTSGHHRSPQPACPTSRYLSRGKCG